MLISLFKLNKFKICVLIRKYNAEFIFLILKINSYINEYV